MKNLGLKLIKIPFWKLNNNNNKNKNPVVLFEKLALKTYLSVNKTYNLNLKAALDIDI